MPVRTKLPRTTHQWLKPLYDALDKSIAYVINSGASGVPKAAGFGGGVPITTLGNASGTIGLYGGTGLAQVATGGNAIFSPTYLGASGFASTGAGNSGFYTFLSHYADNGGSGTPYCFADVVNALKVTNILPA